MRAIICGLSRARVCTCPNLGRGEMSVFIANVCFIFRYWSFRVRAKKIQEELRRAKTSQDQSRPDKTSQINRCSYFSRRKSLAAKLRASRQLDRSQLVMYRNSWGQLEDSCQSDKWVQSCIRLHLPKLMSLTYRDIETKSRETQRSLRLATALSITEKSA